MIRSGIPGRLAAICLSVLALLPLDASAITANDMPTTGMGIHTVSYFGTQWIYANALRQARPHWSGDAGQVTDVDADGYPNSVAVGKGVGTYLFRGSGSRYPKGQWVLEWAGNGECEISAGASLVSSGDHRKVYEVTTPSSNGLTVRITRSDAADRVRNIRVWMPGTEDQASLFHPLWKERLEPFGILRFMDAFRTNGSSVTTWSQRSEPSDVFQSASRGMAYEHAIDLCNEMGKELWLNVPHAADATYIENLATLMRDRLNPNLRVWVEYTNETWNTAGGFKAQNEYVAKKAAEWGLTHNQAHARLTHEMFGIFERVFAGQTHRLLHVMGGQAGRSSIMWDRLAYAKTLKSRVDVAAIAPYFTDNDERQWAYDHRYEEDYSPVFPLIKKTIDDKTKDGDWAKNNAAAKNYGIPLVAFEFNQSLRPIYISGEVRWIQRCMQITRDPRMEEMYRYALDRWRAMGGGTNIGYNYVSAWSNQGEGQFGHLEYQDQPLSAAPLFRGISGWTLDKDGAEDLRAVITASTLSGPAPLSVTFQSWNSVRTGPNIRSASWDFGDGTGGDGRDLNKTYSNPGTYTVKLTVTDYNGNSNTAQTTVTVGTGGSNPPPTGGSTYEAESAALSGGAVFAKVYAGYTGTGFVDLPKTGGIVNFTGVAAPAAGSNTLRFRYALGATANRNVELLVNGAAVPGGLTFTPTGSWSTWRTVEVPVTLNATGNTVRIRSTGQDGGNFDGFTVVAGGTTPPPPPPPPSGENTTYQVENGTVSGGAVVLTSSDGYTGTGFVDFPYRGGTLQFTVNAATAGAHTLRFRYALNATATRNVELMINGAVVSGGVTYSPTGAWNNWTTLDKAVNLQAGTNTIRLRSIGQDSGNVDSVTVIR